MSVWIKSPLFLFVLLVLATAALTAFAPGERSLGAGVRIVYLRAAWVLTAEAALGLSALAGLLGILSLQLYFIVILLLTMVAAWFMTRWWLSR